VNGKPAVVEEARQNDALVARVADGLRGRRLVEGVLDLSIAPRQDAIRVVCFPTVAMTGQR
jgi:hypothetical protein